MAFVFSSFKQLDFNPKIAEDVKSRTLSGAAVSLIGILCIVLLFLSRTSEYLTTETKDHLFVDTSRGEKLKINVDVTFPKIPCAMLSLDVMDVSGGHQLDVDHNIIKGRLDQYGNKITEEKADIQNGLQEDEVLAANATEAATQDPDYCGSCYGAEEKDDQCCNTCNEVKDAYHKKGWAFQGGEGIEQCIREGVDLKVNMDSGEGCNVRGYLEVNKVAGNFHFAPGRSFQHSHMHVHDMQAFAAGNFDVSHVIKRISFGEEYPGIESPLDNTVKQIDSGGGIFQYYVKVVPTTYTKLNGEVLKTNQYSVTDHETRVEQKQGRGLPGVFFFYDLSPIMVSFTETRPSFSHYLTQLCAIVGGIFTVTGMIDRIVYGALQQIGTKIDLGKFS